MSFDSSDVKFLLSYLGAMVVLWKSASWITRKQIIIENFLVDIRNFMESASQSLQRIETNHLVHIENALTGRDEYIQIVAKEEPPEEINDAV